MSGRPVAAPPLHMRRIPQPPLRAPYHRHLHLANALASSSFGSITISTAVALLALGAPEITAILES